jgi:hypothetical protein
MAQALEGVLLDLDHAQVPQRDTDLAPAQDQGLEQPEVHHHVVALHIHLGHDLLLASL